MDMSIISGAHGGGGVNNPPPENLTQGDFNGSTPLYKVLASIQDQFPTFSGGNKVSYVRYAQGMMSFFTTLKALVPNCGSGADQIIQDAQEVINGSQRYPSNFQNEINLGLRNINCMTKSLDQIFPPNGVPMGLSILASRLGESQNLFGPDLSPTDIAVRNALIEPMLAQAPAVGSLPSSTNKTSGGFVNMMIASQINRVLSSPDAQSTSDSLEELKDIGLLTSTVNPNDYTEFNDMRIFGNAAYFLSQLPTSEITSSPFYHIITSLIPSLLPSKPDGPDSSTWNLWDMGGYMCSMASQVRKAASSGEPSEILSTLTEVVRQQIQWQPTLNGEPAPNLPPPVGNGPAPATAL
ncbi:MAG: hypothetical protein MRY21_07665 [Simkaniaceae bacterium]|nr:hypothetical protein [Simkaniaceae bacterium]